MDVMGFRGHTAVVDFDDEDKLFVGHLVLSKDIVGFHAETREGLKKVFQTAVDDYIETFERVRLTAALTPPPP